MNICRYVEKQVGDGTTSAVILSSLIYNGLIEYISENELPPRVVVNDFVDVVKEIQERIESKSREITLDDIYDISMISTNGNAQVSKDIRDLYELSMNFTIA